VIFVHVDKASIPTLISRRTDQEIRNKLELENRTGNSTRIAWPCLFQLKEKATSPSKLETTYQLNCWRVRSPRELYLYSEKITTSLKLERICTGLTANTTDRWENSNLAKNFTGPTAVKDVHTQNTLTSTPSPRHPHLDDLNLNLDLDLNLELNIHKD
jgi:hypothetical protein